MKRSSEAFWWSLFSAGGVLSALFMPAFIVVTGLLLPFGGGGEGGAAARYERVHHALAWWPVRLAIIGIVLLAFVHCAHRIRHILMDVGLRERAGLLGVACYGGALAGGGAAAWLLLAL